jgi:hypothetical protein
MFVSKAKIYLIRDIEKTWKSFFKLMNKIEKFMKTSCFDLNPHKCFEDNESHQKLKQRKQHLSYLKCKQSY